MSEDHAPRVIYIYRRHAAAFDRDRLKILFERAWLDRFLALAGNSPTVLDLGCGSGEPIARHLIDQGCGVTNVDTSPAMLAMCRRRFPAQIWVEADMRVLALRRRFDAILAWDSYFFLPPNDQCAMFPIFRAHANSGAPLLFTSGDREGEVTGSYRNEPLYHASLDPDEYESLLGSHGFSVIKRTLFDPDCDGHCVWLARYEG